MKSLTKSIFNGIALGLLIMLYSCNSNHKTRSSEKMDAAKKGTYRYDIEFLKKHTSPIELINGDARVLISPEYQGRVMTSSADGLGGLSFGWINHDLIASGEVLKQINPVGGEERFWLGPEGGQYSIFFKNGSSFDFENWATPACLDTEAFNVVSTNKTSAEFTKSIELVNYNNFKFHFDVVRKINLLDNNSIKTDLGIEFTEYVKAVAYQTSNQLKNTGNEVWKAESGLLSVWMLGMYNPSDEVTILVPYKTDAKSDYIVKDDYFGEIPKDRLVVKNGMIYFKGDGKERGKIGIPPQRALPVIGSYDAINKVLTVLKCEIPAGKTEYVNSAWELQEFPYKGDAINSYNDGPLEDGSQMGPFYELETSSPALSLRVDETATYKQTTIHFQGDEKDLDDLCQQIFNVNLAEVKSVF
ncbi:hypothetical protein OU798_17635 [Prolixibacteraceae bacterium Z1-6]|uniref:Lipoprotein n=1 Tax=Draconibacterium aestuarii TaxID=2998507 RepID=A0A9X3FFH6_9BACT|nr:hypothetical protein [Prolixibacteraceae bacterium Z1-6]